MNTYTDRQKACEQESFEQFLRDKKFPVLPVWQNGKPHQNYALEVMWDSWQGRAALETTSPMTGFSEPDGGADWKLAMRVLQSDLYAQLDDAERAECDALVRANPYIAAPSQPAAPATDNTFVGRWTAAIKSLPMDGSAQATAAHAGATLTDERIREIENEQARINGASRDNLTARTVRACFAAIKPEPRTPGETVLRFGDDGICRIAQAHMLTDLANAVCLEMSELPDRNSPEDDPEAMIANDDEMHGCIANALEKTGLCLTAATAPVADSGAISDALIDNYALEHCVAGDNKGRCIFTCEAWRDFARSITARATKPLADSEALTDERLTELAVDHLHIDYDRMPAGVVPLLRTAITLAAAKPVSPDAGGMTDAQIDALWLYRSNIHNGELIPQLRDFARAVLSATGGKPK